MNPQFFIKNLMQQEHDAQITYAGLICDPIKAIKLHANNELQNNCKINYQNIVTNNSEFDLLTTSSSKKNNLFL